MNIDLPGRIRNTNLPYKSALLPLFEAIVNSIHAIEDLGLGGGRIDIYFERDETQLSFDRDYTHIAPIINIVIEDNGIGFTDEHFNSFCTSDSTLKKAKGAKGIGRFVWLKAFDEVQIKSQFQQHGRYFSRSFDFVLSDNGIENVQHKEVEPTDNKTTVKLNQFKPEYQEQFPQTIDVIAVRIIEHYLVYFISDICPTITLFDSQRTIVLNDAYKDGICPYIQRLQFPVKHQSFELIGVKFYTSHRQSRSELHLCANHRDVLTIPMAKYLPDSERLTDEQSKSFVFFAYISGEYLDAYVNVERTDFLMDNHIGEIESLFVSKQDIIKASVKQVKDNYLGPYLESINETKWQRVESYIQNQAPQYRPLLKYPASLSEIPLKSLADGSIDLELYKVSTKIELALKEKGRKFLSGKLDDIKDLPRYKAEYNQYLEQENELGKAKLAQYIAHRKIILTLLSNSLERGDDGKYSLEESIHGLIFPLRQTSDDIDYERHNLWIIDEKLAYHKYLASDQPFHTLTPVAIESDERPDIIIFNSPFAFVEDSMPFSSVIIIEFKRPMRQNYSPEDNPFEQVYGYIRKVQEGNATDKRGRLISVTSNTPFYTYILCDLTHKMKRFAENQDFTEAPDKMGYFKYHSQLKSYIEIISYDKLLEDAKKRNRVLFDKLNLLR
jgi:anti-sigma regulatory factor (Ser/Thr protein kinase)